MLVEALLALQGTARNIASPPNQCVFEEDAMCDHGSSYPAPAGDGQTHHCILAPPHFNDDPLVPDFSATRGATLIAAIITVCCLRRNVMKISKWFWTEL